VFAVLALLPELRNRPASAPRADQAAMDPRQQQGQPYGQGAYGQPGPPQQQYSPPPPTPPSSSYGPPAGGPPRTPGGSTASGEGSGTAGSGEPPKRLI
jgi:hypothetical protein